MFENGGGPDVIEGYTRRLAIGAIIAIGGEGTRAAAERLTNAGLKVVDVPRAVDNDLNATDYSFGFGTAVHIATEAIDRRGDYRRIPSPVHDRKSFRRSATTRPRSCLAEPRTR
ncbi:6-phosphofructokinase [Cryobacterium sp. Hb1]|uniref:6-phosphofructokinase n=1 Tax=Cryobacterium sp. Hb1 TaxID=1259147 RepID=UPI00351A33DC